MSNLTTTAKELSEPELMMESCPTPPSLAISAHSSVKGTPQAIREWLMSSRQAFPVNPSASPESNEAQMTNETCGPPRSTPFASYDHATACWRTSQLSLLTLISEPFSETWPKAGIVCDGDAYRLPRWERRISEIGSGYVPTPRANEHGEYQYDRGDHSKPRPTLTGWVKMWPTPAAHDIRHKNKAGSQSRASLSQIANMLPTPTTRDWRSGKGAQKRDGHAQPLTDVVGGQLNPTWVEWLIGWPIGWTDLNQLGMDKFRQWLRQHGIY